MKNEWKLMITVSASIFLINEVDQIIDKKAFGQAFLMYMISVGTTTDILILGYAGDEPGKIIDMSVVVHPDCHIQNEYVESKIPTFLRTPPAKILYYSVLYNYEQNKYTIQAATVRE